MAKDRETKSTRDKAAAARAEQVASEKRRERTVRIIGAIGVVVVVVLIIGLAVVVPRLSGDTNAGGTPMPAPDPTAAGEGWTSAQFVGFAEEAGIVGVPLEQFNDCLTSNRYLGWAANSTQAFYDANVEGTPRGYLNGVVIDGAQLADQALLADLVAEATSAQ